MKVSEKARRYEQVPTEKLKFILGVGRAGLRIWPKRSPDYLRVTQEIAEIEAELKLRGA